MITLAAVLSLALLCTARGASAAPVAVVHAGTDGDSAVKRVARETGRDEAGLHAVALRDLVAGRPPALQGPGELLPCRVAPATNATLREAVERAEGRIRYMDNPKAVEHLDGARESMLCLSEPVDPATASRAAFLRAVVATDEKNEALARSAFRIAMLLSPGLAWDETMSPDGRALFDAEAAAMAADPPAELVVAPAVLPASLWVDGRHVDSAGGRVRVAPGDHLVQVAVPGGIEGAPSAATIGVRLGPDDRTAIVLPAAGSDDLLEGLAEPEVRRGVSLLLATLLGEGTPVYLAASESTWFGMAGADGFARIGGARRSPARTAAMWTGIGVFAATGSWAGIAWLGQDAAADRANGATSWHDREPAETDYDEAVAELRVARWATVGGVLAAGAGTALGLGWPVTVVPSPVAPGLAWETRW